MKKVDGVPIKSLVQMIEVMGKHAERPFVEFELDRGGRMVFNKKEVKEQNSEILLKHCVGKSCSDDLKVAVEKSRLLST